MQVQDQEKLSHLIAQTTTDAFVAIDPDNRVIYWNRGAEQLFGWNAQEILGQSLDRIVPHIHRANHSKAVRRLSEGNEPRLLGKTTNVTALCRDGRSVDIELALTHWDDPATGQVAGYAAIMRDAGERLRLEAQRDSYQRKLQEQFSAIEATSDGVAITDAEGFFVYMNHAHCDMFGYSDPSALIGRHWSVLYSDDGVKYIEEEAMRSVFATGNWRGEAQGVHRDGSIVEQEVALARSPGGGLVCTTRGTGERKRALRERIRVREQLLLAERQELMSRAVSGVAHDFANLIVVIAAAASTLRLKSQSCPPELERIEGAAKQASEMLDLVLAPHRADPPVQVLDAKSALATAVDLTAVTLKPYQSIKLKAKEDGIALEAAESAFLRVMLNLLGNARDALPADRAGAIEITIEKFQPGRSLAQRVVGVIPEEPSALITVTDTGCGIKDEDIARIFEPFQTTKSFGTGLGLVVVAGVVTEAGGSIHVQSTSRGTMFQLVWPLAKNALVHRECEDLDPKPGLQRAKILVVDDNPSVLDLIASEVRKTGADVTAVASPLRALDLIRADLYGWDAAIVDYDMPEMNGAQLAVRIRDVLPHLRIILCSALREIELNLTDSPFDEFVAKSAISTSLNHTLDLLVTGSKVARA